MKIELDLKIYPLEAILNACYAFIDRAYIFLDMSSKAKKVIVTLKEKQKSSLRKLKELEGDFMNEVLHSAVRCKVSKNNKKIREYIIGRALYSALPESELDQFGGNEELDYKEDSLGIAVPWEEKYKENKTNV